MKTVDSPYHPPRAGKFGRWRNWWYRLRRTRRLERLNPPVAVETWPRLALWIFVPGTLFLARGQRWRGTALLTLWLAMLAAYWIWIGTSWSSWAYVFASVVHTISATLAFVACLTHRPRKSRVLRASLYGFLVALMLYTISPLGLTRRVVLPIQNKGTTVLINTAAPVSNLRRGDWIAYRFYSNTGVPGFNQILALPGETIRFHTDAFEVNGTAYQRVSEQMPSHGQIAVAIGTYFVWPAGAGFTYARDREPELLLGVATVPENRVIGPAYRRWLWRKQPLEPLVVLQDWTPSALRP